MALAFSYVVGFGRFLLGDARTSMVGCFPFLSFTVSLVGVGFGLDVLGDLGTSSDTSATSGVTTWGAATSVYFSISCAGPSTTFFVLITCRGADITLSISARDILGKFADAGVCLRASKNFGSISF